MLAFVCIITCGIVLAGCGKNMDRYTAVVPTDQDYKATLNYTWGVDDSNYEEEWKVIRKNVTFCGQEIKDNNYRKISFNMFENDIFVAGLCKGRHDIPMVNKYIFDTLSDKEFKNPIYLENRAKGFIFCFN